METNRTNEHNKNSGRNFNPILKQEPKTDSFSDTEKKKELLFILEDDEKIIKLYNRIFSDFSLIIATSIKEGEEKLSEIVSHGINLDIFITDYYLPDGTSEKFVSKMRERFPKIRVILCSSDDSSESAIQPDAFLSKVKIFEIKSKIEQFFKDANKQ